MTILGHDRPMRQLRACVEQGRLSNCYLFVGPDGVGKTTVARWFAMLLSCQSADPPCAICSRCRRLEAGTHPDCNVFQDAAHPLAVNSDEFPNTSPEELDEALQQLFDLGFFAAPATGLGRVRVCSIAMKDDATGSAIEERIHSITKDAKLDSLAVEIARHLFLRGGTIRFANSFKIELVRRGILDTVVLSPLEMEYRLFILDDAHRMTVEAQNALLKTLEEPPATSIFVLVTDQPNLLLPTIASRSQQLVFRGLPEHVQVPHLIALGADELDAALAARHSRGSLLATLRFEPSRHRLKRDELLRSLVASFEGELEPAPADALLWHAGSDTASRRQAAIEQLELAVELVRDALALALNSPAERIRHQEAIPMLRTLVRQGPQRLFRSVELFLEARYRMGTNADPMLQILALESRLRAISRAKR